MRSNSCHHKCSWAARSKKSGPRQSSFRLANTASARVGLERERALMGSSSLNGRRSSRPMKLCFCKWQNPVPSTSLHWRRSDSALAHLEGDRHMEADKTTRINRPEEEPERRTAEQDAEERPEIEEPQATGFGARFRQLIDQAKQGEPRPNIKRQQLKQDRTKSFLMLAGSMVVMALLFFAMFSSPSSTRRNNSGRPNTPNLGRGPNGG